MKKTAFVFILLAFYTVLFSQDCDETFTGEGTFYGYGGGGNCSFPYPGAPAYTGAMNQIQYDSSMTCGACVEVTGNKGSIVISIEDRCPECKYGDIDLSEDAFPFIDDKVNGRVPISWKIVPCPVQGAVKLYFKEGSSQWWTAVQVRNHKYPVVKLEYKVNNEWVNVHREMYNYFVVQSGMGPGPFSFRITDMYGDVIVEDNVPLLDTTEIIGQNQFPDCNGSSEVSVTGVALSPNTVFLVPGMTSQLTATVSPANASDKSVNWTSDNTGVATINTNGVVTGISEGNATITVVTNDGSYTASCIVAVDSVVTSVPVTGVTISPTNTSVDIGGTIVLNASVSPDNATDKSVGWSTSDANIATVDQSGVVTGVSAGSTTITVNTTDGNFTASSAITVKDGGGAPCDNPTTITIPFSQDGTGDYCFVTSQSMVYVNSWNMDKVEINGEDYTNVWSDNFPAAINGNYYIHYAASVPWAHFEAPQVKTTTDLARIGESLPEGELLIFPNLITDHVKITLPDTQGAKSVLKVIDNTGRVIKSVTVNGEIYDLDMADFGSGVYSVVVYGNGKILGNTFIKK
jgi:expansin